MMLVCGSIFSQSATQIKDRDKVVIDTITARLIANDLISGDVCHEELKITNINLSLVKKQSVYKDSIISSMNRQKDDLKKIIAMKDTIYSKQREISATYKKSYQNEKGKSKLFKIATVFFLLTTGFFAAR